MRDLLIVGASGFGMEVLWLAERCGRKILGFLDDTPEKQDQVILGYPVLGVIDSWHLYENSELVIAIGSPRGRRSVVERIEKNCKPTYATLIDPSALIGKNVTIQPGTIVCAGVICTVSILIGRHVIINLNTTIGHETVIDDFCTISPNASISGNIILEGLVEVGTGAKLREKITVGNGCIVGMGSVLIKSVEPNKVVVGNPAHIIKSIE